MLTIALLNVVILSFGWLTATSAAVISVEVPKDRVAIDIATNSSFDIGPVQGTRTGPVISNIEFQWHTAADVHVPEPVVVPAGTRVTLCPTNSITPQLEQHPVCVARSVQFRTTRPAILDGKPCDEGLFIAVYVSCGPRAVVPALAVGDGGDLIGKGQLPLVTYTRPVLLHEAGRTVPATLRASGSIPTQDATAADRANAKAELNRLVDAKLKSIRGARLVSVRRSPLGQLLLPGEPLPLEPQARVLFYTDDLVRTAIQISFPQYLDTHPGVGPPDLSSFQVRSTKLAADGLGLSLQVLVGVPRVSFSRLYELTAGCAPKECVRRLTSAGVRVTRVHFTRPWLRHLDLARHIRFTIDSS